MITIQDLDDNKFKGIVSRNFLAPVITSNNDYILLRGGQAQHSFESAITIPQLEGSTSAIAIPQLLTLLSLGKENSGLVHFVSLFLKIVLCIINFLKISIPPFVSLVSITSPLSS
jgi:hypothetical protein